MWRDRYRAGADDAAGPIASLLGLLGTVFLAATGSSGDGSSDRWFGALCNLVQDAVLVVDRDGNVTHASSPAARLLGAPAGALVGKQASTLLRTEDGGPFDPWKAVGSGAVRGETASDQTLVRLRASEVEGHVLCVVRDESRVRDAEQRLAESAQRLAEYTRALERSNEELEQFGYRASHDLQEPLRTLSSYLQLLERRASDELSDESREYLDYAVDGAQRLQAMVKGLLELSRVDTRGSPFGDVDLGEVVEEVEANLEMALAETGGRLVVEEDLPAVRGDRGQLVQLLQNLVANAVKFRSPHEPPVVHVRAVPAGDGWEVQVEDNGIGMEPAQVQRVFDAFERLHGSGEYEGSGLGLAIVKRIAERHGGDVDVESTPGEGSTFMVHLPRDGPGDDEAVVESAIVEEVEQEVEDTLGRRARELI